MPDGDQTDAEMDNLMKALNTEGEESDAAIKTLADAATVEESLVNESEIAPPKASGAEEAPTAEEKAAAEAAQAEEAAKAAEESRRSKTEDRDRLYLHDGLSSRRKAELQVLADNPDMDLEQVKAMVDKKLEGIEDEPANEPSVAEQAQAAKDRLAEVNAALRLKEKDFKHDEEWEKLSEEKDKLMVDVPELDLAARIEAGRNNAFAQRIEDAEARANTILPGLNDETSPEYALVAGRVAQLIAIKDGGKELPSIEVDGVKHALDPDNPDFPVLVATEIAASTKKEKPASEAKPEATEQRQTVKRQLVPTPASSPVSATHKPQPEGAEQRVSLKDKAAAVKTDADLSALLEEDGNAWNTGSGRFAQRVL